MVNSSHWSGIEPYLESVATSWITGEDAPRIAAYEIYDAIYWTAPQSFQITLRGQEGDPLYIPSGRKIVETAHRYMATSPNVVADPAFGTDVERAAALAAWNEFSKRERFSSKFSSNKRDGLKRGDWLWHIVAEPSRDAGSRISIYPLHPGNYFPEYLNGDLAQRIAVHLVEPTVIDNKPAVAKLSYRKESGRGGPSRILTDFAYYPANEWGQPETDMKLGPRLSVPEVYYDEDGNEHYGNASYSDRPLPENITSLPVYHIPNGAETHFPWGSSEMRGLESLMRGINQAATDEDITLALEGLGVYVTDAGQPVDDDDEPIAWSVGPARVIELPDGKQFTRVNGSGTVAPYQEHLTYLHRVLDSITGENDITSGMIDVAVAESGVAIALKMAPLFSRMDEKELVVTDVHAQMFFDLAQMWFPAYEPVIGELLAPVRLGLVYGERLPINKDKRFEQIVRMATTQPPIISGQEARRQLEELGWTFSDGTKVFEEALMEMEAWTAIQADATAARMDQEIENLNAES